MHFQQSILQCGRVAIMDPEPAEGDERDPEEIKKELAEEKKRLISQAAKEKEELKNENKQLIYEISRLKVIMRG